MAFIRVEYVKEAKSTGLVTTIVRAEKPAILVNTSYAESRNTPFTDTPLLTFLLMILTAHGWPVPLCSHLYTVDVAPLVAEMFA